LAFLVADKLMHHPGATLANFPFSFVWNRGKTYEFHAFFFGKTFTDGSRDEGWT